MVQYVVLVKIIDKALFGQYLAGHLPTIARFGGKIIFRSTENTAMLGSENWDVIAIQEWPDSEAFDRWWNSEEYRPWAELRDCAAAMTIVKSHNSLLK